MQAKDIQHLIESHLPDTQAIVEGDDGVHFSATVISPAFANKTRVEKQQLVYASLGNRIADGTIHALSMKTFTPDEWKSHTK